MDRLQSLLIGVGPFGSRVFQLDASGFVRAIARCFAFGVSL